MLSRFKAVNYSPNFRPEKAAVNKLHFKTLPEN